MARIGINPARGMVSDYRPAKVSVTMLSYIPELTGYFAERLKILSLAVASLIKNTTKPYDLVVFDNGSCQEVLEFWLNMQAASYVDYLILSKENIGKIGALRILFHAAPGEIIAYSDDDILFYPGWLEEHLRILEAFPQAGMVSGVPVRNAAPHAHKSLDRLIQNTLPGLSVSRERRIPDDWERDWAVSTGRDVQAHLDDTKEQLDIVLRTQESSGLKHPDRQDPVEAIGSANHFQFMTRKETILQALPVEWSGKLMGHMLELDQAVDDLGYLRLSTCKRTTRHLGNALHAEVLRDVQNLGFHWDDFNNVLSHGFSTSGLMRKPARTGRHWLTHIPGFRRVMVWTYKKLFGILYR